MDSETEATIEGRSSVASVTGMTGDMSVDRDTETGTFSGDVAIGANGALTITIVEGDSGEETTVMEGFFNEDASMALLTNRYGPTGGDPTELGLVVLVEVTE